MKFSALLISRRQKNKVYAIFTAILRRERHPAARAHERRHGVPAYCDFAIEQMHRAPGRATAGVFPKVPHARRPRALTKSGVIAIAVMK